jgi:hypothetical protein
MFSLEVTFRNKEKFEAAGGGSNEDRGNMVFEFSTQPPWSELTERFLLVLKSMGYVFDYDVKLGLINENGEAVEAIKFDKLLSGDNEVVWHDEEKTTEEKEEKVVKPRKGKKA